VRTFDGGVLPERTCVVNYDGFAEGMLLLSSFFLLHIVHNLTSSSQVNAL
jgi:hypothetical protein